MSRIENINSNFKIYPNPTKDYFNVNTQANRIEIYDISGRKIMNKTIFTERKIYREDISNGLYIYRLYNEKEKQIENGKIIFE